MWCEPDVVQVSYKGAKMHLQLTLERLEVLALGRRQERAGAYHAINQMTHGYP